ncbi:hypothetical protein BU26DRAFT_432383, partial [Trematosphaeria pertusa]
ISNTYDHRIRKIRYPVRSTHVKPDTGGLVVRWVTTSEYPAVVCFCLFFGLRYVSTKRGRSPRPWTLVFTSRLQDPSFPLSPFQSFIIILVDLFFCLPASI